MTKKKDSIPPDIVQKDFFRDNKDERIIDLKRKIYEELLKPYRRACLSFVNMRHDNSFRTEEEDLQEIYNFAENDFGNSDYTNHYRNLYRVLKEAFLHKWNAKKYHGGWK